MNKQICLPGPTVSPAYRYLEVGCPVDVRRFQHMFLKHEEQQEPLNISPCDSINLSVHVVPISSCHTLPPFPQKNVHILSCYP